MAVERVYDAPVMQPAQKPHSSTLERVPLKEAAEALGLTESGARARFRRGELQGERDNTGKIWVYITPVVQPAKQPHKSSDDKAIRELVTVLKDQLAAVTAERDTYRAAADEATRAMAELAGLQQKAAILESERDDLRRRLDVEGEERRKLTALLIDQRPPWWRRLAPRSGAQRRT